jgi:hypothetical protein
MLPIIAWAERQPDDARSVAARVAQEIQGVARSLQIAESATQIPALELEVMRGRAQSATAREVLRVLDSCGSEYLRRGEIQKRMSAKHRPTSVRVGQLLSEMHARGLIVRIPAKARGAAEVAFYALSPLGKQFYDSLYVPRSRPATDSLTKDEYYRRLLEGVSQSSAAPVYFSTLFKGDLRKHQRAWAFHEQVLASVSPVQRPVHWVLADTQSSRPLIELAREAARRSSMFHIYRVPLRDCGMEDEEVTTTQVLDDAGYVYPSRKLRGAAEQIPREVALDAWNGPKSLAAPLSMDLN